jgi:hypothetical protein
MGKQNATLFEKSAGIAEVELSLIVNTGTATLHRHVI